MEELVLDMERKVVAAMDSMGPIPPGSFPALVDAVVADGVVNRGRILTLMATGKYLNLSMEETVDVLMDRIPFIGDHFGSMIS